MSNITLSLDDELIRKVRKIALDRNTSLNAMVREYLESVAQDEKIDRAAAVARMQELWERTSRPFGPRTWTRDDLHER